MQKVSILNHLLTGATLTAIEALNQFGCFRLSARIGELKDEGYEITGKMVKNRHSGKFYKRYKMEMV